MYFLGVIVIDELHMVFDSERGAILENIISKILYASIQKGFIIFFTLKQLGYICNSMSFFKYTNTNNWNERNIRGTRKFSKLDWC